MSNKHFNCQPTPREELFGKAKYAEKWIALTEADLKLTGHYRDANRDYVDSEGAPPSMPPNWQYRGPIEQRELAETAWKRALTLKRYLEDICELLRLLDEYGPDFNPLEELPGGGNPTKLKEARDLFQQIKNENRTPDDVEAHTRLTMWRARMSYPPGLKCWTPNGQDLGVRLRALDGTSNFSGDEGRSYTVGEDRTVVVHSKDVAPLTAGGKFELVEDTSADKVTVRSYTASDLDGLTFPEAFQKFVIGPIAEAFQRFMFERGGLPGEDFLKDGSLFGPLLKHGRLGGIGGSLWPVDLDKLISRVPSSSAIRHLIRLIVERWGTLIEFLRQGELVATDIDDFPLPIGYWKRKGMSIDIENGDMFEVGTSEPLRLGLALSLAIPTTTAMSAPKAEIEALVAAGVTEPKARSSSAKAESQCRAWLGEQMRASPHERPMAKEDYLRAAVDKYLGLSKRGFERAWTRANEETEARWNLAGRPKKSPQ